MINQYGLTLEVPSAFFLINNTFGNTLFVAPELVNAYARPCLQKSYSTLTITTDLKCWDYYNFYEFHQTMPKTKRELFFQFNNILDPCIVKRWQEEDHQTNFPKKCFCIQKNPNFIAIKVSGWYWPKWSDWHIFLNNTNIANSRSHSSLKLLFMLKGTE